MNIRDLLVLSLAGAGCIAIYAYAQPVSGDRKLDMRDARFCDRTGCVADGGDVSALKSQMAGTAPITAMAVRTNLTPVLDTTYSTGGLNNGVIIRAGGNQVSYCPTLSCYTGNPGSFDHQRAGSVFWSTTSDDGHSEEQTVAVETIVATGLSKRYANSTNYSVGDNVETGTDVYRVTTAGTSAASGSGPTGYGSGISNGSMVVTWINSSAINAKVGWYNEELVMPGGGKSWVQANNVSLQFGMTPTFNINTELDFTNNSGKDCALGTANCNSLEMNINGTNKSTTGIHLGSNNSGSTYAAIWGIRLNGAKLASDADFEDDASAAVGIGFNVSGLGGTHSIAAIQDSSVGGLNSIVISGTKSSADINILTSSPAAYTNSGNHALGTIFDNSNSPIVIAVSGNHAAETINDISNTPAALNLGGHYSVAAINTQTATTGYSMLTKDGQSICFNGTDACFVHLSGKLYYQQSGQNLMSVADGTGNAVFKGTVTQSGTP